MINSQPVLLKWRFTDSGYRLLWQVRLPHSLTHELDHKEARVIVIKYFSWTPGGSTEAKNCFLSPHMVSARA
jgi:hypothetical protein